MGGHWNKIAWTQNRYAPTCDSPGPSDTGGAWNYAAAAGRQPEVNVADPAHVSGHIVVGVFHTRPNPSQEGWELGPSEADRYADDRDGVRDLIRRRPVLRES